MKLKEMDGVGVWVANKEEALEYQTICDDGGWFKQAKLDDMYGYGFPTKMRAFNNRYRFIENTETSITLAEFKKEQVIMKYSAGDVLVKSDSSNLTIQGYIGEVYIAIAENGDGVVYAEKELHRRGYTLKTESTKTDMSVSEIEKALGKAAGSLNVVAE